MRKLFKTKKGLALLATLVVAGAAAFAAYAFLTATGGGTGSSSVTSSVANWEDNNGGSPITTVAYNDESGTNLWPGNPATALYAPTLYNPNPGPVQLQQVVVTLNLTGPVTYGDGPTDCDARNFEFVDPGASWTFATPDDTSSDYEETATYNAPVGTYDVAANSAAGAALPALSVQLVESGGNQDACEGAQVTLTTSIT